jgi:Staygreen protein
VSKSRLKPEKLKFIYKENMTETNPINPRRYTLTHSDTTGDIFGGASMRESIFLNEMPLVLEALRFGDRLLFDRQVVLDGAVIRIHLQSSGRDYRVVEMGSPT